MHPFFETYRKDALNTAKTGILPSVKLAQAALETAYGNSGLSKNYSNFFGIKKGSTWTGTAVNMATNEVINGQTTTINDYFRVYDNARDSFADHTALIYDRFPSVISQTTPEAQARALQNAGYATDPAYADKLINIINQNDLKTFDKQFSTMKNIEMTIAILTLITSVLIIYKFLSY